MPTLLQPREVMVNMSMAVVGCLLIASLFAESMEDLAYYFRINLWAASIGVLLTVFKSAMTLPIKRQRSPNLKAKELEASDSSESENDDVKQEETSAATKKTIEQPPWRKEKRTVIEPVFPKTVEPVLPKTVEPVAPKTVEPIFPKTLEPILPKTVEPIAKARFEEAISAPPGLEIEPTVPFNASLNALKELSARSAKALPQQDGKISETTMSWLTTWLDEPIVQKEGYFHFRFTPTRTRSGSRRKTTANVGHECKIGGMMFRSATGEEFGSDIASISISGGQMIASFSREMMPAEYKIILGEGSPAEDPVRWRVEASRDRRSWFQLASQEVDFRTPFGRGVVIPDHGWFFMKNCC